MVNTYEKKGEKTLFHPALEGTAHNGIDRITQDDMKDNVSSIFLSSSI